MNYKLEDLIDIPLLQELQDKLNVIYSFPSAIIDNDGKILTAVALQDICTKFHRINPESEKECIKSDKYIADHLHEANPAVSYECPHGLIDNATPIIIEGIHLGNFFTGQFFLDKPDLEFFKKQAQKYGFDESAYLEAVQKVPIWSKEKLHQYLDFIKGFIEIIAGIGLKNLREIESNKLIKANEERLKSIIMSTSDWIWEVDKDGKYIYSSEKVKEILGYSVNEIIGKTPFDLMPIEEKEHLVTDFQKIVEAKGSIVDLENWNIHKNGHRVCLLTNGFPVLDASGEIIGYRGADKDIKERKLAEEELKKSDERFRSIFNNAPIGIYRTNKEGKILLANPKLVSLLGYTSFEELQKRDIKYEGYEKPETRDEFVEEIETKGFINNYEVVWKKKDGTNIYVNEYSRAVQDNHGNILYYEGTVEDITERKRTSEALKESEDLFFAFMHHSPVYIYIKEVFPNESRVIQASQNFHEMIGIPGRDMIGKTMHELFPPKFAAKITADDWEVASSGKVMKLDETINDRFYTTIKFPIVQSGRTLLAGYTIDITERKMAENALRESEEKFRAIIDVSPVPMALNDESFNITFLNRAFIQTFGYTHEDIPVLQDWWTKAYPNAKYREWVIDKWITELDRSKLTDSAFSPFEVNIRCKNGTDKTIIAGAASFTKSFEGSHLVVLYDITERKLSEKILQDIIDKNPMSIQILDMEGYTIQTNLAHTKTFGAAPPADYSIFKDEQLLQQGLGEKFDRIKNGEVVKFPDSYFNVHDVDSSFPDEGVWIKAIGFTLNDSNGIPERLVLMHENITERKKAEAMFHDIIDKNPMSIQIVDMNGFTLQTNASHTLLFGSVPPSDFSIFDDLQSKGLLNEVQLAKSGEVVHLPDVYFNPHDIYPELPDIPLWIRAIIFPLKDINGKPERFVLMHENITERKQAEESLRDSEELFKSFVNNSSDMTALTDENDKLIFISPQCEKILGFNGDIFIGQKLPMNLHPDDMEMCRHKWETFKKGEEEIREYDYRIIDGKGDVRWLSHTAKFVKVEDKVLGIQSTIRNITERKLAEEKIREKDMEFRKLSANVPDLIFQFTKRLDGTYCVPIASEGIRNIFACTPEDVLDDFGPIGRVIHPDDAERVIREIEYSAEHLSYFTCEFRVILPEKGVQWIYSKSTPEKLPDGCIAWYGFNTNITERKLIEEELAKQKQFFEQMFMQSSVSTQILDKDGWCERINPKLGEIFGVEPQHIEGKVYNIFNDEAIRQGGIIPHLERAFKEGKTTEWEVFFDIGVAADSQNIEVKEKKKVWYSNWAYPIFDESGNISHVIIQHNNISERKNAEELLLIQNKEIEAQYEEYMQLNEVLRQTNYDLEIAKDHAEESDKLKTAFLQNMSHEIRTPLNGIIGFSNLLSGEDISHEDIKEFTGIIKQSGNRLIEIINNVLDISKIETGQIVLNKKSFSVNSLIADLYLFFSPLALAKDIELNFHEFLTNSNDIIHTDDSKLSQILTNLINNAIKFTPSGSIDFGYEIKGGMIQFYVKDTGIGISPEHQEKIFDRFTQIDLSITRGFEGAGLGLAICKGLVEFLGGEIWVESEVNIGTTFFLNLPYISSVQTESFDYSMLQTSEKKNIIKILIVEDDYISFQYLNAVLKNDLYSLLHAENGEEAVNIVKNTPDIDMILMDIRMPVMNGFEATRLIKEIRPDVPVIAQTAYAFSEERDKILAVGCDDYLSKPIRKEYLLNLIDKYSK